VDYYNGGSWFRAEYSAYVVGLRHGWRQAGDLMENRAWAETNLNPDLACQPGTYSDKVHVDRNMVAFGPRFVLECIHLDSE
jgi:hypothetical protein